MGTLLHDHYNYITPHMLQTMYQFHFWDTVCLSWWPVVTTIAIGILSMCILVYYYWSLSRLWIVYSISSVLIILVFLIIMDTNCILPNTKLAFQQSVQVKSVPCLIESPDKMHEMKLLKPPLNENPYNIHRGKYYLLGGPHGSGKMTPLKLAI